jgi:hypothetical protein
MDNSTFLDILNETQRVLNILYFAVFTLLFLYFAVYKLRLNLDTAALVMLVTQLVVMVARLF